MYCIESTLPVLKIIPVKGLPLTLIFFQPGIRFILNLPCRCIVRIFIHLTVISQCAVLICNRFYCLFLEMFSFQTKLTRMLPSMKYV